MGLKFLHRLSDQILPSILFTLTCVIIGLFCFGLFFYPLSHRCNIGHVNYSLKFTYYNTTYNVRTFTQFNIITYLLTYSMEHSPSWEANQFSASQEIPCILGTWRFITVLTSARHLSLSWANSIQFPQPPTSQFLNIHLNIILPSTSGSPQWSFFHSV